MHGPGCHQRIASVPTEVEQHAKARVIHRLTELLHILRHGFRTPVILRPDLEAAIVGTLRILTKPFDNQIKLFWRERRAAPTRINPERLRPEILRRIQIAQRPLIVLLAHRRVIFPDMRPIHTQIHQRQLPLC